MAVFGQILVFLLLYGQYALGQITEETTYESDSLSASTPNEDTTANTPCQGVTEQPCNCKKENEEATLECKFTKLRDQVAYFAAGAATTLGLCIVISIIMVLNGLIWQRCSFTPEYLQRNGRGQSRSNNYQDVPRPRAKTPDEYGFGGPTFHENQTYDGGMWALPDGIEDDADVYYSMPYDETGQLAYAQSVKQKPGPKKDGDADCNDDMEIEDNAIYNLNDGANNADGAGAGAAATGIYSTAKDDNKDDGEIIDNDLYNLNDGIAKDVNPSEKKEESQEWPDPPAEAMPDVREENMPVTSGKATNSKNQRPDIAVKPTIEINQKTQPKSQLSSAIDPPESIIHSLSMALKERQKSLKEQAKTNEPEVVIDVPNNYVHSGPNYDDNEELYSNMDAENMPHFQPGSNQAEASAQTQCYADNDDEIYSNMDAFTNTENVPNMRPNVAGGNHADASARAPRCYADNDELYSNTAAGYDDEPLYGNIDV